MHRTFSCPQRIFVVFYTHTLSITYTGIITLYLPCIIDLYYSTTLTGTTETTTEILQELYPTTTPATETGPGATTASSLTITTITDYQDCSKTVQTREAVAWALLFLVVLLFTGLLFINVIIVFLVYKHRQRRDNTAEALAYEMADNPCYESSKISNTLETNIYEQIEPERVHM